MPRPRTGQTPIRHVRLTDKMWAALRRAADRKGRSIATIVRDAVEEYLSREDRP